MTRSGVLKATIAAVVSWFKDAYIDYTNDILTVALARNITDLRSLTSIKNRPTTDEAPLESDKNDFTLYPSLRMTLGDLTVDTNRAGANSVLLRNNKRIVSKNTREGSAIGFTAIPVVVTIGARFISNNMDDVIAFIGILAENMQVGISVVDMDSCTISSTLKFDGSFTIPQSEGSPGDPFIYEFTATLSTFIGTLTEMRIIRGFKYTSYGGTAAAKVHDFSEDTKVLLDSDFVRFFDYYDINSKHYTAKVNGTGVTA